MTVYVDTGNITSTLANITNLLNQLIAQGVQGAKAMSDLKTQLADAVAQVQASAQASQQADQANQQADAAIQTSVNAAIALINTLHTSGGGGSVSDADVQAAVDALKAAAADNSKATADFSNAVSDYNTAASNLASAQPQP